MFADFKDHNTSIYQNLVSARLTTKLLESLQKST